MKHIRKPQTQQQQPNTTKKTQNITTHNTTHANQTPRQNKPKQEHTQKHINDAITQHKQTKDAETDVTKQIQSIRHQAIKNIITKI